MIKRNKIGLSQSEIPARAGEAANSGGRVWLESVSAGMRTVEAVIRELSQNDVPVLVVAEHGSGKAAAAARIHALSVRAAEPFQAYQGRDASAEILADGNGQRRDRLSSRSRRNVHRPPGGGLPLMAPQITLNGTRTMNSHVYTEDSSSSLRDFMRSRSPR